VQAGPSDLSALAGLTTESRRPELVDLDVLPTVRLVELFLAGEVAGLQALLGLAGQLGRAVDAIAERFGRGGRNVYVGAGTAGRLGWLDAVECVPTFGVPPQQMVALLAGGAGALINSREGDEDDEAAGRADIKQAGVGVSDAVVAVSASGRTPYTLAAAAAARTAGALTVAVVNNSGSPLAASADVAIEAVVGPEFIAGSTRLKAGTAQKVLLNALSTLVMVRTGRTLGDLMVDVQATNDKLRDRGRRVVMAATGASADRAAAALNAAGGEVKTAIVMAAGDVGAGSARASLADHQGSTRGALLEITGIEQETP